MELNWILPDWNWKLIRSDNASLTS